jgi:hypothetical protein
MQMLSFTTESCNSSSDILEISEPYKFSNWMLKKKEKPVSTLSGGMPTFLATFWAVAG